jgi:hypothetical protein
MVKIPGQLPTVRTARKTSGAGGQRENSEKRILAKALDFIRFLSTFRFAKKVLIDYNKPYFSAPVLNLILREPQTF